MVVIAQRARRGHDQRDAKKRLTRDLSQQLQPTGSALESPTAEADGVSGTPGRRPINPGNHRCVTLRRRG
eukprot:152918-Lingulodinium_polyedra.AAC.1